MVVEITAQVSGGEEEKDVITFENKYVEKRRYTRVYRIDLNSISHWNNYDDDTIGVEIHFVSGFSLPIERSIEDVEDFLLNQLINADIELLSLKEKGFLKYLITKEDANPLEGNL
jgi:hypothetical protein